MNLLTKRCLSARFLSVMALGCLLMAGLRVRCGAEPEPLRDVEGVRLFLKRLTLDDPTLVEIDAAVGRLDSPRFAQRYQATAFLKRLPVLPWGKLERAAGSGSLEKRMRLSQVMQVNTPERTDGMIIAAMEAVMDGGLEGLLPEIIGALDGRGLDSNWEACVGACETAALPVDEALLKRSLTSQSVAVRGGAAAGLIKIAGKEAMGLVEPLVDDPDDRIKLMTADFLKTQRNPNCLKAYAALLLAEDFSVRWKSLDTLRQMTNQDFEFYASAKLAERQGPAKAWMDWVLENGATAQLNFDIEAPDEIVLFNGKDLEGWKEVKGFFKRGNVGKQGWGVEDGKLICFGGAPGHLRTAAAFKDFRLKLQYRTPGGRGDSGLGLFLTGADKVAPACLEVQLINGRVGDLYQIGGFKANDAAGNPISFRAERIADPVEEEDGWNQLEVAVVGGTVEVSVNGEIVNRATGCPDGEAMFTLRNEGSRFEFRDLLLVPLD